MQLSIISNQVRPNSAKSKLEYLNNSCKIAPQIAFAVSSCEEAVHNFRAIEYQKSNFRVLKKRNLRCDGTEISPGIVAVASYNQRF